MGHGRELRLIMRYFTAAPLIYFKFYCDIIDAKRGSLDFHFTHISARISTSAHALNAL